MRIFCYTFSFLSVLLFSAGVYGAGKDHSQTSRNVIDRKTVAVDLDFVKNPVTGLKTDGGAGLEVRRDSSGLLLVNRTDGVRFLRSSEALKLPSTDSHTVHRRFELRVLASGTSGSCVRILAGGRGFSPRYVIMTPEKGAQDAKLSVGKKEQIYHAADDLPDLPEYRIYFEVPPHGEFRIKQARFTVYEERSHAVESDFSGNIVPADSARLVIRPLPGKWTRCSVVHQNEYGNELGRYLFKSGEISLPVTVGRGFHKFQIRTEYSDGQVLNGIASAAVLGNPLAEKIRRASPYGLMTNHLPEELAVRASSNHNWHFWYPSVLKLNSDGTFPRWNLPPSKLTRHYAMNGVLPSSVIDPKQRGLRFPRDPEGFARLLRAWAASNAGNYDLLSVYNEPDGHFQGTASEFVEFHKLCAGAIKEGAPGTRVYGPVLSSLNQANRRRLAEWMELGLLKSLDGVNVHPYVDGTPPEGEFLENLNALHSLLAAHGYGNLPVHLTEFGWTTLSGTWQKPVSELQQAQYAARAMALLSTQKIASAIYFCGRYNPTRSTPPGEIGFSLCERNLEPKPGYAALAFAMKQLAPFPAADGIHCKIAPGVHLVFHLAQDRTLLIGWTEEKKTGFSSPLPIRTAHDMMGRSLSLQGQSLMLTPSPVYLELPPLPGGIRTVAPLRLTETETPGLASGEYRRFRSVGGVLEMTPVTVVPELAVMNVMPLPGKLRIQMESARKRSGVEIKFLSKEDSSVLRVPELQVGTQTVEFPYPSASDGRRHTGRILTVAPGNIRSGRNVDFRILTARKWKDFEALSNAPSLSLSEWDIPEAKTDDLSGSLRLGYTPDALLVELILRDDDHVQKHTGINIWQGDSIQIGLDADAGTPWQPNVARGFNGHRVAEYAAALHPQDGLQKYRHIAWIPGLQAGSSVSGFSAKITRSGKETRYLISIKPSALGLEGEFHSGMTLGFSLTVNDVDNSKSRRTYSLGGGIAGPKDPRKYIKLYLQ